MLSGTPKKITVEHVLSEDFKDFIDDDYDDDEDYGVEGPIEDFEVIYVGPAEFPSLEAHESFLSEQKVVGVSGLNRRRGE